MSKQGHEEALQEPAIAGDHANRNRVAFACPTISGVVAVVTTVESGRPQWRAPTGNARRLPVGDGGRWWSRTTDLHDVNVALYP